MEKAPTASWVGGEILGKKSEAGHPTCIVYHVNLD
jgi:hypothetical protein